jgi:hypothetical protein
MNQPFDMRESILNIGKELRALADLIDGGTMPVALIFAVAVPCVHDDVDPDGVDIHRVFDARELADLHSLLTFVESDIDGELGP